MKNIVFPIIFGFIFAWIFAHLLFRSNSSQNVRVISHRGAAGIAPENTIAAVNAGQNYGADFVEIDVQRSADGVLVILHDKAVDRTTDGTGKVAELTWAQISKLDAGKSFSSEFAGESIPSLEDVFSAFENSSTGLVVEIKDPELYPEIETQVIAALRRFELEDRVVIVSFDHKRLTHFSELAPEVRIGYLYVGPVLRLPTQNSKIVSSHWLAVLVDPTLVWRMHRQDKALWVWTVNSPTIVRFLVWLGVDGFTTDRPDLFVEKP